MSFEGYYQILCKNGHEGSFDCYANEPESWTCPVCKEKAAWWNLVDQTNGSFEHQKGKEVRIDGYVELKEKETKSCKCCGQVTETTYHIPEDTKYARSDLK